MILYDAARCPYCARVRIAFAEKSVPYDPVEIDLDDRPAWIYEKNPAGRVPVLEEEGGLVLPESRVIMEYLEERYPEPRLLPAAPAERALARLLLERFDDLAGPYYDLLRGRERGTPERVHEALARIDRLLGATPFLAGAAYTLADIGYLPWVLRAEARLGLDVRRHAALADWLERLEKRPAVAEELELLARAA